MQEQTLDGHHGRPVAIDLCHALPVVLVRRAREPGADSRAPRWRSSGSLASSIGQAAAFRTPTWPSARAARARLRATHDMQRTTRFEYLRCPNGHGRLTTFFDFLREKDFIRPLTPQQIAELRQNVQIGQLLELRRARRPDEGRRLRALRLAAVDARHAAGGSARRAARRRRTIATTSRSIRRCRSNSRARGARSSGASPACRRRPVVRRRSRRPAWSAPA